MTIKLVIEKKRGAKLIAATLENFWSTIRDQKHIDAINTYRSTNDQAVKRNLAGIPLHAESFSDGKRHAESAKRGAFTSVDFDKLEEQGVTEIRAFYKERILPLHQKLGNVFDYITPSGNGLRLTVKTPKGMSIRNTQLWIGKEIGLKPDTAPSNVASLFFLPKEEDILFIDEEALFGDEEIEQPEAPDFVIPQEAANYLEERELPLNRGVRLTDIALRTAASMTAHPLPLNEGERNKTLFKVACALAHLTDNPAVIAQALPSYGLDEEELLRIAQNACNQPHAGDIPKLLKKVINELREEAGLPTGTSLLPCRTMPTMPPLFRQIVASAPKGFEEAVAIILLPLVGFLATGIRFDYLDGTEHRTTLFACLISEQASGKSCVNYLSDLLLEDIRKQDDLVRAEEERYQEALKRCKNDKKQPEPPNGIVREVPVTISVAKLLKRMVQAAGKHMISICDEIDTFNKTNNAGAWSEKTDIYRKDFDGSRYGVDYAGENSYSAMVRFFYNLLLAGTPPSVFRFFLPHINDGTVTRFAFATLPDNFGGKMPKFKQLTDKEMTIIKEYVAILQQTEEKIKLPKCKKAFSAWVEEKRLLALETQSKAIDIFRKRAAVIGMRASAVAYVLCGNKETKTAIEFGLWVADYVLQQQVKIWGDALERAESYGTESKTPVLNLYKELPDEFTRQELKQLRMSNGQSDEIRTILSRWRKEGMIEDIDKNTFRKTKLG